VVVQPDLGANFNTNVSTYVDFIGVPHRSKRLYKICTEIRSDYHP